MSAQGFKDLKVYQIAYQAAMEIFILSKAFPKEEVYSLTDQVRRSSRSICTCIAEAYRKRSYPKYFSSKITDADGECSETLVWLDFAFDCGYMNKEQKETLIAKYIEIGRMLGSMALHPEKFSVKKTATATASAPAAL